MVVGQLTRPGESKNSTNSDKYKGLVEKSLVGAYIIQDGLIKFANTRFLELFGAKRGDMIGEEYTKFVAPESKNGVVKGVMRRERGEGGPKQYTFKALKKDGSRIDIEVFSVPTTYRGNPAVQGIAIDITERKEMEEELQRSESKYKTLVEEMLEGLWVSDCANETLYWNKSLEKMLGYELKDVLGRPIYDFVDDENMSILKRELSKRRKGEASIYELQYISKSGKYVPVLVSGAPTFDENGEVSGSFAVLTDISERKTMERELITYTGRVKKSNMLKDLFADIILHDLMNPLGIIRGYAGMMMLDDRGESITKEKLADRTSGFVDDDKTQNLKGILNAVDRIIEIIEDSNRLVKLESESELEFESRDLGKILHASIESFKRAAEKKNMTIDRRCEGKYQAELNPLINEVFTNLISNAIKYSPANSEIIVDIADGGDNWKITVEDSGPGVADEYKKNVFKRFERRLKEGVKGTGIGLAIVERVVNLHRGRVWIEDNPKGGSVFCVSLPKTQDAADAPSE